MTDALLVSGVAVGLPNVGSKTKFSSLENLDRIVQGTSFLTELSSKEKMRQIEKNINKMVVKEGKRVGQRLSKETEVIGVTSLQAEVDLTAEYGTLESAFTKHHDIFSR